MANVINATQTGNGGLVSTGDDSGILNIQTNETTAVSIDASQNLTFTNPANLPNTFGFKNRLINGNMQLAQRSSGSSTPAATGGGYYGCDRWQNSFSQASKVTVGQNLNSVTPPTGFTSYYGFQVASAVTIGASDYFIVQQAIEGYNCQDFAWGGASAASVTLSFWVRSSVTGTFGGSLFNYAGGRSYPFTYTISAANTWEQKYITIAGDTAGTWTANTNSGYVTVCFSLGTGSSNSGTASAWNSSSGQQSATGATSIMATLGATFYITGVQLEKGTQATSFDFRSYGTELALCQRYYETGSGTNESPVGGTFSYGVGYKVAKRSSVTVGSTTTGSSNLSSSATYSYGDNSGFQSQGNFSAAGYRNFTWTAASEL